jgi:hypothetical protein
MAVCVTSLAGGLVAVAAAQAPPAPPIEVSRRGELLSVTVREAPLGDVLRAIGERTGVHVKLGNVPLSTPVTASFTDVPIDQGIRRLARGYSLFFVYGATPTSADGLTEVWVIDSASPVARDRRDVVATATPPAATPPTALGGPAGPAPPAPARPPQPAPESAARMNEVNVLARKGDTASAVALARMVVQEPDPAVRAHAALALVALKNASSTPALASALGNDQDAYVRRLAARALGMVGTPDARRALQASASDSDESVRREVARALSRFSDQ